MKNRWNELRVRLREHRSLLLLVAFPLLLGILLFFAIEGMMGRELRRYGELEVEYLAATSQAVMDEAARVAERIAEDSLLTELLDQEQLNYMDRARISQSIAARQAVSDSVAAVYLVSKDRELLLDRYGSYTYDSGLALFRNASPALYFDPAMVEPGWNVVNRDYAPPYYVCQLPAGSDGKSLGTLVLVLDMNAFQQTLRLPGTAISCLFNEKCDICTLVLAHEEVDWRSEQSVSRLLGQPVHCIYRQGEGFTYLVAVATREYWRPLNILLGAFGVYFLLVLAYSLWQMRRLERQRVARIAELVEELPEEAAQGGGYEDQLNRVREALRQYEANDKSSRELLRERNLRYLLSGHSEDLDRLTQAAGIRKAKVYYLVTIFVSDFGAIWEAADSREHVEIVDVIFHAALEQFLPETLGLASVDMYPRYAAVFSAFSPETAPEELKALLERFAAFLRESFQMRLQCLVSDPLTDLGGLGPAYGNNLDAYELVTALGSDSPAVFIEELVKGPATLMGGEYIKQLQMLTNALTSQRYELVPSMTEALLTDCVLSFPDRPLRNTQRLHTLTTVLVEGLRLAELSPEEFSRCRGLLLDSRGDAAATLEAVRQIYGALSRDRGGLGSDYVQRACGYIEEHLDDSGLSLPKVCEAVGCSVQHLSRLFKQEKDSTINEYINDRRIRRAAELLGDPELTVAAVAAQVGYVSMDTFTRNFRRRQGVTPSEYRGLQK